MRIGLYSDLAQKAVVSYRSEIFHRNLAITTESIKSQRAKMNKSLDDLNKKLRSWSDYYSMTEVRDLIFHVQEHRFTLPQIANCLDKIGLKFCVFESDAIRKAFKLTNPERDSENDLLKWHSFERDNPDTFFEMYQFWCQKTASK